MTAAIVIALTIAAALILWEAWARLIRPNLAALTAAERRLAALAERTAQPLFNEAEKDVQAMAESPVVSAKLTQLGAAIAALKTRAETAEKALTDSQADIAASAARQGELDQANGHIADLTAQVADLQAQLAAEKADHADDVNAVAALADAAAPVQAASA